MRAWLWSSIVLSTHIFSHPLAHAHPMLGDLLVETDNGPANGANTLDSDLDMPGPVTPATISADDFQLNAETELTGVRWWGGFKDVTGSTFSFDSIAYEMRIYSSVTDMQSMTVMPETLLATRDLTVLGTPSVFIDHDDPSNKPTIWEITATIGPSHISGLTPGTNYWISIYSVAGDGNSQAIWGSSMQSGNNAASDINNGTGDWSPNQGFELAFVLFGENVVPEPTSFALLGMGALGFMGYAWRQRKRDGVTAET